MADGCVEWKRLTPNEETELISRLILSFEQTPKDWSFNRHTLDSASTKIELWTANGESHVGIWRPSSLGLSAKGQHTLWGAIHTLRHSKEHERNGEIFKKLTAKLPKLPEPPESSVALMLPEPPKRLMWRPMLWLMAFFAERPRVLRITDQRE